MSGPRDDSDPWIALSELYHRVRGDTPSHGGEWSFRRTCRVTCRIMDVREFGIWEGVSVFCVAFLLAPTRKWILLLIVSLLFYELSLYLVGRIGHGKTYEWSPWTRLRVVLFSLAGYIIGKWWWRAFGPEP